MLRGLLGLPEEVLLLVRVKKSILVEFCWNREARLDSVLIVNFLVWEVLISGTVHHVGLAVLVESKLVELILECEHIRTLEDLLLRHLAIDVDLVRVDEVISLEVGELWLLLGQELLLGVVAIVDESSSELVEILVLEIVVHALSVSEMVHSEPVIVVLRVVVVLVVVSPLPLVSVVTSVPVAVVLWLDNFGVEFLPGAVSFDRNLGSIVGGQVR